MAALHSHADYNKFRRISSAPSLQFRAPAEQQNKDGAQELEFYIHCRQFSSWCGGIMHKIPKPCARVLKESGVGHFLLVVKTNGGQLHSFDFGPVGGEITLKADEVREERLGGQARTRLGAQGEIREEILSEMPADAMYVGRTSTWTIEDIRIHNSQQPTIYKLHENDCRHYVNRLLQKCTGIDLATVSLLEYNHEQRTRAEREAWLASVARATSSSGSGGVSSSSNSSSGAMNTDQGSSSSQLEGVDEEQHCQKGSINVAATLSGMQGLSPAAMTFMLPILANAPAWDTPLVMLGRFLSHPYHWPSVQAAGQGVAFASAVGVMRAAAFAAQPHITALATTAAAASSGTPVAVAGSKASLLISRTAQTLAGTVTARIPYLAPVAKAIAASLKTKAAQIAAPVAYVAQSSMRGRKESAEDSALATTSVSSTASSGSNIPTTPRTRLDGHSTGSLAEYVKCGLIPLPARSPQRHIITEQSSTPTGLSVSMLGPPRPKSTSTTVDLDAQVEEIAPAKPVGIFARWFWYTRKSKVVEKKQEILMEAEPPPPRPLSRVPTAARLSAAHIQAAVTPEGPSSSMIMPRKRLLSSLIRFRPLRRTAAAANADDNAFVNANFALPSSEPRRFFSLPGWFSMKGFRNTALLVPAAVVAHTAGPAPGLAERRGWWALPVPHPLPPLATTSASSSDEDQNSHMVQESSTVSRFEVHPLEQESMSVATTAPVHVSFLPSWLSFKRNTTAHRYEITASASMMDASVSSEYEHGASQVAPEIQEPSDDDNVYDEFSLPTPPVPFSVGRTLWSAPSEPLTSIPNEDLPITAVRSIKPTFAVRTLSVPALSLKGPPTPSITPVGDMVPTQQPSKQPLESSFAFATKAESARASTWTDDLAVHDNSAQSSTNTISGQRLSLNSNKSGEFPHMPVLPPAKVARPRRFLFKLKDSPNDQTLIRHNHRYTGSQASTDFAGLFLAKDPPTASKSLASVGALVISSVMQERWSMVHQVVV